MTLESWCAMAMLAPFIALYFLVLPVIGLLVALVLIMTGPKPVTASRVSETLMQQYLLWAVGLAYLTNCLLLLFFAGPSQFGVAIASLGISVVGLYALRRGRQARFAALLSSAVFLWGSAVVYGFEILTKVQEFTAGTTLVLLVAVALPFVGFALLRLSEANRTQPTLPASTNADSSPATA